jgi:hypothetical protein
MMGLQLLRCSICNPNAHAAVPPSKHDCMRLPIAHLLALERSDALRWVHPYNVSLEPGRPRPQIGAVLFFNAPTGRTYTCRLVAYVADQADVEYTGPKRPREHMLELIELVRVRSA